MIKDAMFLAIVAMCVGCTGGEEGQTFTLYRNSVLDANMRLHVATFNTTDGEAYNRENCEVAQHLFQAQPDVKTKFWCEKGTFKK